MAAGQFTDNDLALLADFLETALADDGFIDTTSGGGYGREDAAHLRTRMAVLQSKAHAQTDRSKVTAGGWNS